MNNKKTLWIIVGLAVLAVIIIVIAVSTGSQQSSGTATKTGGEIDVPVAPTDLDKETPIATPEEVEQASSVVEGTSKVIDNVVVTPTGKPARTDVHAGSPEAPQQTPPINPEDLPAGTIRLEASAEGFNPPQFEVRAGQLVTLSLTSVGDDIHIFVFDDPQLSALAMGFGPGETKAITFNAPAAGEYSFHCDVPGHAARGEVGKMIVK